MLINRVLFTMSVIFFSFTTSAQDTSKMPFEKGTFYVEIYSVKEDATPVIDKEFFVKNKISERHQSERVEFIYDKERGLKVVLLSEEEVLQGKRVPNFFLVRK